MTAVTDRSFGILIAYLLPGFLVIATLGQQVPLLREWLAFNRETAPTVGGFLYVTLASIGAGLLLSTIRWAVIDQIHRFTGLKAPEWDASWLQENIQAYRTAVEFHYRYYQFYANMIVAVALLMTTEAITGARLLGEHMPYPILVSGIVLFFAASRDALAKYYRRSTILIPRSSFEGEPS